VRAVILSCGQRKIRSDALLPAVERYDGPYYRVLRKYLRRNDAAPTLVWIVSAEFGLIEGSRHIPFYDRRMTQERARQLAPSIASCFSEMWRAHPIESVLVNLSADYAIAVDPCLDAIDDAVIVERTSGGIGTRSGQLRRWLYSGSNDGAAC